MKKLLQVLTAGLLVLMPACSDDENGPTGGDDTGCCVIRGDVDHSGGVLPIDIVDLVYLAAYVGWDGPEPPCLEESDVDGDGEAATVSDRDYLRDYMFFGGPEPPACP